MKILPIALVSLLAVAVPGFAQEPGNPAVYAPGEMARAEFTLDQRTDEGGRLTPFYTNYRPNIAFGGGKPMKCEFFTEQEGGHKPGTVGEIGMTCPATTSVGQAFTAYERKRLIGRGVILPPLDGQ